jgi:uncharacterized protein
MARCVLTLCVLILIGTALPAAPSQAQVIEPSGFWVTDRGDLLTESEENALSAILARYASESSTQIVIVTLPSLNGRSIAEYAFELGEKWGVGQRGVDNGIVILVSRNDREVFIATGYGIEASVPDVVAGRIIRDVISPSFRLGDFHGGLHDAVDALVLATKGEYEAAEAPRNVQSVQGRRLIYFALLVIIVIVCVIVIIRVNSNDDHFEGPRRPRRRTRGIPPIIIWGGGWSGGHRSGSGFGGSSGGGFGGFGGFSGGGGSFGGGGAGGGW